MRRQETRLVHLLSIKDPSVPNCPHTVHMEDLDPDLESLRKAIKSIEAKWLFEGYK